MKVPKSVEISNMTQKKQEAFFRVINSTQWDLVRRLQDWNDEFIRSWISFNWLDIGRVFFDEKIKIDEDPETKEYILKSTLDDNTQKIKKGDFLVGEDSCTYFDWTTFHVFNKITREEIGSWDIN